MERDRLHRKRLIFFVGMGLSILLGISVLIVSIEYALRWFFPMVSIDTGIGYDYGVKAMTYGWGYYPHQKVMIPNTDNPDELYIDYTNSKGWRDREHTYENLHDNFRILVIGDSNTFGAAVPGDALYTRVLEKRLKNYGIQAEIISMGYGGWGTDQILECFQQEGLQYDPHLFIYQFCMNDIEENFMNSPAHKNVPSRQKGINRQQLIPFAYHVDAQGQLIRTKRKRELTWYQWGKQLLQPTAIGSRLLVLKRKIFQETLDFQRPYHVTDVQKAYVNYAIETTFPNGIGQQSVADATRTIQHLENRFHAQDDLEKILTETFPFIRRDELELIMRLFESQHIFHSKPASPGELPVDFRQRDTLLKDKWTLLTQLTLKMKEIANQNNIQFMIFSEWPNVAHFEWSMFWFYYADTPQTLERYLSPRTLLTRFAQEQNIMLIPNQREYAYKRPRNDPHANIHGNQAIAEDIFDFIIEQNMIPEKYYNRHKQ